MSSVVELRPASPDDLRVSLAEEENAPPQSVLLAMENGRKLAEAQVDVGIDLVLKTRLDLLSDFVFEVVLPALQVPESVAAEMAEDFEVKFETLMGAHIDGGIKRLSAQRLLQGASGLVVPK